MNRTNDSSGPNILKPSYPQSLASSLAHRHGTVCQCHQNQLEFFIFYFFYTLVTNVNLLFLKCKDSRFHQDMCLYPRRRNQGETLLHTPRSMHCFSVCCVVVPDMTPNPFVTEGFLWISLYSSRVMFCPKVFTRTGPWRVWPSWQEKTKNITRAHHHHQRWARRCQ